MERRRLWGERVERLREERVLEKLWACVGRWREVRVVGNELASGGEMLSSTSVVIGPDICWPSF